MGVIMRKKYYKIVTINSVGRLYSYCHADLFFMQDNDRKYITVEYKAGEFVGPNIIGTKLYVFDSLKNAKNFAGMSSNQEIWECEVINPNKVKYLAYVTRNCILDFWKAKKNHKKTDWKKECPFGTIACDAVKLTRKVS